METALSVSDSVRAYAAKTYLESARREGLNKFSINIGEVHRALAFHNRIPLVCMALKSKKFLAPNGLRLVSESGPPSGLSTTTTYSYEFVGENQSRSLQSDPWIRLRGALKDIFAELGGGESYLHKEREEFHEPGDGR